MTIAEGLAYYLMRYCLGDGGYTNRWFKINFFWKFTLILPNISNRREAVKFHDLHHVLTEYETGLKGEAEIGAWEIASGCGKYWAAWLLNMGSLSYGFVLYPRAVYRAFIRGRHSKNLYHNITYASPLLETSVAEMRKRLHIPANAPSATVSDIVAFISWRVLVLTMVMVELGLLVLFVQAMTGFKLHFLCFL